MPNKKPAEAIRAAETRVLKMEKINYVIHFVFGHTLKQRQNNVIFPSGRSNFDACFVRIRQAVRRV
jgi:hypothetical protein